MNHSYIFPLDKQIGLSADAIMRHVIYAALPAVVCITLFFGVGVLIQWGLAALTACCCEGINAYLRRRTLTALEINSGLLSALLLAVAVPVIAPWWVIVTGTAFALLVGKHAFGGVGMNIFNPAVVGFCAVYLSFPAAMSLYPVDYVTLQPTIAAIFPNATLSVDVTSGATALSAWKANNTFHGIPAVYGWINAAWLVGGIYLWWKNIADWRLSVVFFTTFFIGSLLFWAGDEALNPLAHTGLGALIFTACFIITDPTSAATGRCGRIYYAALAGILAILIRQYSNMADSMAFAILLANCCAPMIDNYTRPQYYREKK